VVAILHYVHIILIDPSCSTIDDRTSGDRILLSDDGLLLVTQNSQDL